MTDLNPDPGSDTGVPASSMSRRGFLSRAPIVLAVAAAPAAALAAPIGPKENPALLRLAAELPAIEQAYHAAAAAWQDAIDTWNPRWPVAPEACCAFYGQGERERDLVGNPILHDGNIRHILTREEMERTLDQENHLLAKNALRRRSHCKSWVAYRHEHIAKAEMGLALLPGYLAERDRIRTQSNIAEIRAERDRAGDAMFSAARAALIIPSHTIEGVMIKAKACAAIGRMGSADVRWRVAVDSAEHQGVMAALMGEAVLALHGAEGSAA